MTLSPDESEQPVNMVKPDRNAPLSLKTKCTRDFIFILVSHLVLQFSVLLCLEIQGFL